MIIGACSRVAALVLSLATVPGMSAELSHYKNWAVLPAVDGSPSVALAMNREGAPNFGISFVGLSGCKPVIILMYDADAGGNSAPLQGDETVGIRVRGQGGWSFSDTTRVDRESLVTLVINPEDDSGVIDGIRRGHFVVVTRGKADAIVISLSGSAAAIAHARSSCLAGIETQ